MSSTCQIIEHIVLFKAKPNADPTKVNNMITDINALTSLNLTLYLTIVPIIHSKSSSLSFTHILHSRFKSKDDLVTYSLHPSHVSVLTNYFVPVIEDVMAVDWVSSVLETIIVPKPESALRVSFMKLKESAKEEEKYRLLNWTAKIREVFPVIEHISVGENFSYERAKGYSIGTVAVFSGLSDLEGLDSEAEFLSAKKEKIGDVLDSYVVVDYVVPDQ